LLFAVLISSLLLSIGIAILDLTLKEFLLSSAGRESQFAFYAADDAMECALYWDHNVPGAGGLVTSGSSFATSTGSTGYITASNEASLKCNGLAITNLSVNPGSNTADTSFDVSYAVPSAENVIDRPCAAVDVSKTSTTTINGLVTATQIETRGYDTCDTSNPNQTERGIQTNY